MDNFEYIQPLTFHTKSKLGLMMVEKEGSLNHVLYSEGDPSDYLYFVKEGQFEVTKDLYIKEEPTRTLGFRRMYSEKKVKFLRKIFNPKTQILLASADELLRDLTSEYKLAVKLTTKVSVLTQYETIGVMEGITECPYRVTNVKGVSIKGKYMMISKDNFFRRVKETSKELIELVINKIDFLEFRIRNQMQVKGAEIDPVYKNSISLWERLGTDGDSENDDSSLSNTSMISK